MNNKIYILRPNVIFVVGAVNGAIYDLNSEKVYSINKTACDIVMRYILGSNKDKDFEYLNQLKVTGLISESNRYVEPFSYNGEKSEKIEVAWLEVTEKCNLKCVHCYEGDNHTERKNALTVDQWIDVIDQLSELDINRLIIIGGEPCCFKSIKLLLKHASEKEIDTTLFTNATLIDDDLMKLIIDLKIKVKVSIYGDEPGIHDRVTGVDGSFEKMVSNIRKLIAGGVEVSSAFIVMRENESNVESTIAFIKSLGMKYSRYDVIREMADGKQNLHTVTDYDVLKKVMRTKADFKITKDLFFDNFTTNSCWYGKITVAEDGNVYPCEFERNIIYGNVKTESIADILKSDITKQHWYMDFSKIEECCDCEFRFACKDCRPLAIGMCNDIKKKNPRCCYNVYKGIWEEKKSFSG